MHDVNYALMPFSISLSLFLTARDDADSLSQFSVRSGQTPASLAKDQTHGASLVKDQIDSRLLESARMIRSTVVDPLKATLKPFKLDATATDRVKGFAELFEKSGAPTLAADLQKLLEYQQIVDNY